MIGRKVEVAQTATPPLVWQLASPALLTDSIPADATFIWDPITDRIAAIYDNATGALVRQVLHGDLAYDDPIEVTLLEPGDATKINRLDPLYDEAAAGHLEAVLNVDGEVVSRKVVADAYGDDTYESEFAHRSEDDFLEPLEGKEAARMLAGDADQVGPLVGQVPIRAPTRDRASGLVLRPIHPSPSPGLRAKTTCGRRPR